MRYTEALAGHASNFSLDQVPATVVNDVKRLVLDWLGVCIRGSSTETGRIISEYVTNVGGKGEATLVGSEHRVPASAAAFANAVQSHSLELDDVDHLALFHHGPPVVSAALAAAEKVQASGKMFLTGVIAGCEVMNRISESVNPSHRDKGFHTTATCGTFGAAVAAGKVLELDHERMTSCLGLAGAQASGLMEFYGVSMQKRINPGLAARNGVAAALLAERGFTGADSILEGAKGFCRAFSEKYDLSRLTAGLGKEFPIYIEFKPYSCARPIHTAIDCVLAIARTHAIDPEKIRTIVVRRHPAWAHYHLTKTPRSYHEAQVSLPYSVAVALFDGTALLEQYSTERIRDEAVLRLANKVEVVPDDKLTTTVSVATEINMVDGTRYAQGLDYPKGAAKNPLTNEELESKFRSLASTNLSEEGSQEVVAKVNSLESVIKLTELTHLLHGKAG